ncbi:MAG: hypothetical protein ACKVT0_13305 [Planctomycetaceae bacterium]
MRLGIITTLALVAMVFASADRQADARPDYLKKFLETYPDVKAAAELKCGACHGKDKKNRNNYAKAVGTALGAKNVKDADKIAEALKAAEEKDSATEGKTFGDLLKAGELPGEKIE